MKSVTLFLLSAFFMLGAGLLRVYASQGSLYCGGQNFGCYLSSCALDFGSCPDGSGSYQATSQTGNTYWTCVPGNQPCGNINQVVACVTSCWKLNENLQCVRPAVCVLYTIQNSCK